MANTRFFSQIPAWVDELDNVSDFQVRLLGFIYTVSNTGNHAFPSNTFLANKYHKSTQTVQRALSDLYEKGLLRSRVIYREGTKYIEKRILEVVEPTLKNEHTIKNEHTPTSKTSVPYPQKRAYPTLKNEVDNRLTNRLPNKSVYT
ncbi:helix-turn-helix domain-containing protein, partial [Fructobacillus fructosus]|uniref:helix-turn-helix domain-containing protein n=1 Tax=Fructobacillus fructosus TaxID=1631 RepID=UPI0040341E0B